MTYFVAVFASLLLIAGICWVVFINRWMVWFSRKLHTEAKVIPFLSSTAGRLGLWAIRMSGLLWIAVALVLFDGLLQSEFMVGMPSYLIIILIALPLVVRVILLEVMIRITPIRRRKIPPPMQMGREILAYSQQMLLESTKQE